MLSFLLVAFSEIDISGFALHVTDDAIFMYGKTNQAFYMGNWMNQTIEHRGKIHID